MRSAPQNNQEDMKMNNYLFKMNKKLEQFNNLNYRIRGLVYSLFSDQILGQAQEGMIYEKLKIKLEELNKCSKEFSFFFSSMTDRKGIEGIQLTEKEIEFQKRKNEEIAEAGMLGNNIEILKSNFVGSMFKGLFDVKEVQIMKEFLIEDNSLHLKNSISQTKFNEITADKIDRPEMIIGVFQKIFPSIKISYRKFEDYFFQGFISVEKSFQINLNIFTGQIAGADTRRTPVIPLIKVFVTGLKEGIGSNVFPFFRENKNKPIQYEENYKSNSKYILFKKLNVLFEKLWYYVLKCYGSDGKTKASYYLWIFCNYISQYNNLFDKKCYYCKNVSKFNPVEKCFFPPYYRYFDLERPLFFHEDCFAIVYNTAA